MKNRPLREWTLHAAEGALGARQRRIDPPRLVGRKVFTIGVQQVTAFEARRHLALLLVRLALESSSCCVEGQRVIPRHPRITLLEAPDRLTDLDLVLESAVFDSRLHLGKIPEQASFLLLADRSVLRRALAADAQDQGFVVGRVSFDPHSRFPLDWIAG